MSMYFSSSKARRPRRQERTSSETMSRISITSPSAFTVINDSENEQIDDGNQWTCEDERRYPLKDPLIDPWEQCYDVARQFDEDMAAGLKDEISNLLVVASLFLAIVTAFVLESQKWLKEDSSDRSADLLEQLIKLSNHTGGPPQSPIAPLPKFSPDEDAITINQLWFLSMTQSLAAVVLGTLCLQWLSAFTRKSKPKIHDNALALRQMRYEGFVEWGIPRVPAILLLNVQGALVLFTIGLIWFLFTTNKAVAFPVAIVAGVAIFFLVLTTLLPLLQSVIGFIFPRTLVIPQCPFKSPISFIIHRSVTLFFICGSYLVQWFVGSDARAKVRLWRGGQIPLLLDTVWEHYDELWRKRREESVKGRGEGGDVQYSHYLTRGLKFTMSLLIAKPSAVHIVRNCIQDIHGSKEQAEVFRNLFKLHFTDDEKELIATTAIREKDMSALRTDFLAAHVLQYFVGHNEKLHRTVLKPRVELFIRVNNTAANSAVEATVKNPKIEVGETLKCPVRSQQDAANLDKVVRRQFLDCVKNILRDRRVCTDELRAVRFMVNGIDLRTNEPDFTRAVHDFVGALTDWRKKGGGVAEYSETMRAISSKFPNVVAPQDQESGVSEKAEISDSNRDSTQKLEDSDSAHVLRESRRSGLNSEVGDPHDDEAQVQQT